MSRTKAAADFKTQVTQLKADHAAVLAGLLRRATHFARANRQTDRDRVQFQEDRTRNERILADSDYLAREIADVRDAMGELATRDYLRGELRDLLEEISARLDRIESAQLSDHTPPVASDHGLHPQ